MFQCLHDIFANSIEKELQPGPTPICVAISKRTPIAGV